jgi:hypothetical protein
MIALDEQNRKHRAFSRLAIAQRDLGEARRAIQLISEYNVSVRQIDFGGCDILFPSVHHNKTISRHPSEVRKVREPSVPGVSRRVDFISK